MELKKKGPFGRTIVVGLGNGRLGYLPTAAQHELGGYETWLGTNVVQTAPPQGLFLEKVFYR